MKGDAKSFGPNGMLSLGEPKRIMLVLMVIMTLRLLHTSLPNILSPIIVILVQMPH